MSAESKQVCLRMSCLPGRKKINRFCFTKTSQCLVWLLIEKQSRFRINFSQIIVSHRTVDTFRPGKQPRSGGGREGEKWSISSIDTVHHWKWILWTFLLLRNERCVQCVPITWRNMICILKILDSPKSIFAFIRHLNAQTGPSLYFQRLRAWTHTWINFKRKFNPQRVIRFVSF